MSNPMDPMDPMNAAATVVTIDAAGPPPKEPLRRSTKIILAVVIAVVAALIIAIVLLLVGRGGSSGAPDGATGGGTAPSSEAHGSPAATSGATAAPTPSPTAPPPPAAFVMPTCSQVALPTIPPRVATGELVEITRDGDQGNLAEIVPGPVAAAAALAAPQVRSCAWGPPNSDGGVYLALAEMTQDQWTAFAGQLAAGGWTAADVGGAPAYTQVTGVDELSGGPAEWWYVYQSGVWITFAWTSTPEVRAAAVAGAAAVNP